MPKVGTQVDILQRINQLEEQVALLRRTGRTVDEVPFWPVNFNGLAYEDDTTWSNMWETTLTPRTASLEMGMLFVGDQVGGVNTGGEWQILLDSSTVAASGTVPATYTYASPTASIDLTPYRGAAQLQVRIQVRRTAGATTGGKFGGGGSIGASIRYARLL
ncbi:hypothetical protein [Streptomyces flaveolus]|uniref:hypothetical protein n=1 Tax=Streptomyces flaveolus TaxID=67297 RepID=UPI00341D1DB3